MTGIEATGSMVDATAMERLQPFGRGFSMDSPPGAVPMADQQAFAAAMSVDRAPALGAPEGIGTQLTKGLQVLHDNINSMQTEAFAAASGQVMPRPVTQGSPGPAAVGLVASEAGGAAQPDPAALSDPMRAYMAASAEQRALTLKTAIHALAIDVAHSTSSSVKSSVDKLMQG
jgi:hypothetical protein